MKPFLKWAGGKGQLLSQILKRFPDECSGTYFEPFLGGGAVFFGLKNEGRIKKAQLTDRLGALTECYAMLKKDPEGVINELQRLENLHDPEGPGELFYTVRDEFNSGNETSPEARAARFIYLNRTCFNGLYRENKHGRFNVPVGRYKNPRICDEDNLRAVAKGLKNVSIGVDHFHQAIQKAQSGDWVYFDPPYYTDGGNFTNYTSQGFGEAQHTILACDFFALVKRGVHVVASNSNHSFIRELYKNARIFKVEASRNIAAKTKDRVPVTELVIVGAS